MSRSETCPRCRRSSWIGGLVVLALVLPAAADELRRSAESLASFRAEFAAAAPAARATVLTELRDRLTAEPLFVEGHLIGLGTVSVGGSEELAGSNGLRMLGWEYGGYSVAAIGCEGADDASCAELSSRRLRTVLPAGPTATMVMVRTEEVLVYALTQDQAVVASLRNGQDVALVMWPQAMLNETLLGVLSSMHAPEGAVLCPAGHRYPVRSGFRFCPQCGQKLEAAD